jgi:hypothetical protein
MRIGVDASPLVSAEDTGGHRENHGRSHDVGELQSGVVHAYPKDRYFTDAGQGISSNSVLLSEDGVRNLGVLIVHPAVADHDSDIIGRFEKRMEVPCELPWV